MESVGNGFTTVDRYAYGPNKTIFKSLQETKFAATNLG
jgi:hypothetical protein